MQKGEVQSGSPFEVFVLYILYIPVKSLHCLQASRGLMWVFGVPQNPAWMA
jgi:hypothetical protein